MFDELTRPHHEQPEPSEQREHEAAQESHDDSVDAVAAEQGGGNSSEEWKSAQEIVDELTHVKSEWEEVSAWSSCSSCCPDCLRAPAADTLRECFNQSTPCKRALVAFPPPLCSFDCGCRRWT